MTLKMQTLAPVTLLLSSLGIDLLKPASAGTRAGKAQSFRSLSPGLTAFLGRTEKTGMDFRFQAG